MKKNWACVYAVYSYWEENQRFMKEIPWNARIRKHNYRCADIDKNMLHVCVVLCTHICEIDFTFIIFNNIFGWFQNSSILMLYIMSLLQWLLYGLSYSADVWPVLNFLCVTCLNFTLDFGGGFGGGYSGGRGRGRGGHRNGGGGNCIFHCFGLFPNPYQTFAAICSRIIFIVCASSLHVCESTGHNSLAF